MKAIKTYISVYPVWYRILVFIAVPVAVILTGIAMLASASEAEGFDRGFIIGFSASILVYAELFGEWFTLGEICARKGAFGDAVLSSPNGRLFVKRFATVDTLRKVLGYPLVFVIQQLVVLALSPDSASIMDGVFIGFIFAFSIMAGIIVIRKTKAAALRFLSLLVTSTCMITLGVPYAFVPVPAVKLVIGVTAAILSILFAFLSMRSVVKSSREDYYDEK